jgi:hypothetical protein
LKCGSRVVAEGLRGVIVGHNSSANFAVLVDDDSSKYPGQTVNVHPVYIRLEEGAPDA